MRFRVKLSDLVVAALILLVLVFPVRQGFFAPPYAITNREFYLGPFIDSETWMWNHLKFFPNLYELRIKEPAHYSTLSGMAYFTYELTVLDTLENMYAVVGKHDCIRYVYVDGIRVHSGGLDKNCQGSDGSRVYLGDHLAPGAHSLIVAADPMGDRGLTFRLIDHRQWNLLAFVVLLGLGCLLVRGSEAKLLWLIALSILVLHLIGSHFLISFGFDTLEKIGQDSENLIKPAFILLSAAVLLGYKLIRSKAARKKPDTSKGVWGNQGMYLLISLLFASVFWILRARRYYGDAELLAHLIQGKRYYLSAPLTSLIFRWSHKLLAKAFNFQSVDSIAAVSVIAGFASIYVMFLLSEKITKNPLKRWVMFLLLTSTYGIIQLFFGHVEIYPPFTMAILAYTYASIKYLSGEYPLYYPALVFGLMITFHLSAIWFLLSLLFLYLVGVKDDASLRETGKRFLKVVLALSIVPAFVFTHYMINYEEFSLNLPLLGGAFFGDKTTFIPFRDFFAFERFEQMFNEYLLLSPGGLILLVLLILRSNKMNVKDGTLIFLLLVFAPYAFYTFIWNPDLGFPQDWDLFSAVAVPLTILGGYTLVTAVRDTKTLKRYALLAVGVSVLHTAPAVYYNSISDDALTGSDADIIHWEHSVDGVSWEEVTLPYEEDSGGFHYNRILFRGVLGYEPSNLSHENAILVTDSGCTLKSLKINNVYVDYESISYSTENELQTVYDLTEHLSPGINDVALDVGLKGESVSLNIYGADIGVWEYSLTGLDWGLASFPIDWTIKGFHHFFTGWVRSYGEADRKYTVFADDCIEEIAVNDKIPHIDSSCTPQKHAGGVEIDLSEHGDWGLNTISLDVVDYGDTVKLDVIPLT